MTGERVNLAELRRVAEVGVLSELDADDVLALVEAVEAALGAVEYARPIDLQAAVVQGGHKDLRVALAPFAPHAYVAVSGRGGETREREIARRLADEIALTRRDGMTTLTLGISLLEGLLAELAAAGRETAQAHEALRKSNETMESVSEWLGDSPEPTAAVVAALDQRVNLNVGALSAALAAGTGNEPGEGSGKRACAKCGNTEWVFLLAPGSERERCNRDDAAAPLVADPPSETGRHFDPRSMEQIVADGERVAADLLAADTDTLPCGHPFTAVVNGEEGTSYCGMCAADTDTTPEEKHDD